MTSYTIDSRFSDSSCTNTAVLVYTPSATPCIPSLSCSIDEYGRHNTLCPPSSQTTNLTLFTSQAISPSNNSNTASIIGIDFYKDSACKTSDHTTHYKLDTCIVSSYTNGDASFEAYMLTVSADGKQVLNSRFSDAACLRRKEQFVYGPLSAAGQQPSECVRNVGNELFIQVRRFETVAVSVATTVGGNGGQPTGVAVVEGPGKKSGGGPSVGVIVGVVLGVVVLFGVGCVGFLWSRKKRRQKRDDVEVDGMPRPSLSSSQLGSNASLPQREVSRYGSFMARISSAGSRSETPMSRHGTVVQGSVSAVRELVVVDVDSTVVGVEEMNAAETESRDVKSTDDSRHQGGGSGLFANMEQAIAIVAAIPQESVADAAATGISVKTKTEETKAIKNSPISGQVSTIASRDQVIEVLNELKLSLVPSAWSIEESVKWVKKHGGDDTAERLMHEHEIDGQVLMSLAPSVLISILEINLIGRQVRFSSGLDALKSALQTTGESVAAVAPGPTVAGSDLAPPAYHE
ncbi:hypothetical protein BDR26DRAFT_862325 [Obelidium mucronatum]|nr:hypothetical protein BDR26DRAFT_862325 [Obelidium mucronatum]